LSSYILTNFNNHISKTSTLNENYNLSRFGKNKTLENQGFMVVLLY